MADHAPPGSAGEPRAGRREWTALAVLSLPLLLVSMDVSVLYFAVPFISRDLHASATQQLWIFDIYGFVLAGLLITMGALGDRIGRRRLLMIGAGAFGLASIAAAYARSPEQLIAARAILGVGGATLMPSTLALLRNMFHRPAERAKAVGVWSAVMMGGISLGPVLSGVLLEHYWWGSVFLMNLPAMLLLLTVAPILLPEFKSPSAHRFDILSSVLSLGTVLPVIWGIKHGATQGFGVDPVLAVLGGLVVGVALVRRQRRRSDPMIDLSLFASRGFSGAVGANVVGMFAIVGNAVFMTQYLQLVLGMRPLRAALWSLLPSAAVAGAASLATALGQQVDRAYVMSAGFLIGAAGFALIATVSVTSPLALVLVGAGLLATGLVAVLALVTEIVMTSVSPQRAGSASAVTETASELGGALGIAVLGSIAAAVYRTSIATHLGGLPAASADAARESLAGAGGVGSALPGGTGRALVSHARVAFVAGMDAVAIAGAGVLVLAALLIVPYLRGQPVQHARAGADTSGSADLPDDSVRGGLVDAPGSA